MSPDQIKVLLWTYVIAVLAQLTVLEVWQYMK